MSCWVQGATTPKCSTGSSQGCNAGRQGAPRLLAIVVRRSACGTGDLPNSPVTTVQLPLRVTGPTVQTSKPVLHYWCCRGVSLRFGDGPDGCCLLYTSDA